jgi:hypothetical protein
MRTYLHDRSQQQWLSPKPLVNPHRTPCSSMAVVAWGSQRPGVPATRCTPLQPLPRSGTTAAAALSLLSALPVQPGLVAGFQGALDHQADLVLPGSHCCSRRRLRQNSSMRQLTRWGPTSSYCFCPAACGSACQHSRAPVALKAAHSSCAAAHVRVSTAAHASNTDSSSAVALSLLTCPLLCWPWVHAGRGS